MRDVRTDNKKQSEKRRSKRLYAVSGAILALAVAICLYVVISTLTVGYTDLFGHSLFRVVTGSMEPTLSVGEVLICRRADVGEIKTGDIICFRSREASHYGSIVTHRVVAITSDETGKIFLESRGDANLSSDPYYVSGENLIGVMVWHSGGEGFFTKMLTFLTGRIGFLVCVAVPVLIIAGLVLQSVAKNVRGELNQTLNKLARDSAGEKPLPGYETLTKRDFDEIYDKLKSELRKELNESGEGAETTEYDGSDGESGQNGD